MSQSKKIFLESGISILIDDLIDDIYNSLHNSPNMIVKLSLELLEMISHDSRIDKSLLQRFYKTLNQLEGLNESQRYTKPFTGLYRKCNQEYSG